ncbi:outer membrane lipoprotein carrier protein LolA [Parapedobacter sp. ISTM3]|uniref:LolA family protein n=1 Tax=Parapedobacter sp. ISTM3 TaxID=2800130 RepID=UPI001905CFED|nr:outer membrane lipoprotein carrier protein LolA [Parapedobacter sp. ISTM3]MBK1440828.1 outer membrane lipoprotein carrier protein LolA [Parapedobacter sp. ISTM3]
MRMRKYRLLTIVLLAACTAGFAQRKALTPAETAAFKEKVIANTRNLKSLESNFTQSKQLSYMEHAVKASGKLYFRAPQDIRWEYRQPTSYVIVFDHQTMFIDEGGSKPKQIDLAANRRLKGLSGLLVGTVQGGNVVDESRFVVDYYRAGSGYAAILRPKDKALQRYIKEVELTFDGSTFLINRIKIIDPTQDFTLIDFENQRKNVAMPEELFAIK